MSNRLEDLEICNLSERFADEIWFIVTEWEFFAKDTLGKQLVRSADSIGANMTEGFGRYHFKENKNFCYFSRGSILESKGWLKKANTRNLIPSNQFQELLQKLETFRITLNAYIKYIGNRYQTTND
jgi:four helix bundle protein